MRHASLRSMLGAVIVLAPAALAAQTDAAMAMKDKDHMAPIQGTFAGAEGHNAAGTFTVAQEGERYELQLDGTFRVDRGPDVFVVLSTTEKPSRRTDLYLGKIKRFSGEQTYEIPAGTDLTKFHYVVLWCERYSVTMGRAELSAPKMGDKMDDKR